MVISRITDRTYAETDGANAGNLGAVVLDDEIVFIDSGMYHQITSRMRERLVSEQNLPATRVLITHHHSDHTWGVQGLRQVSMISSHDMRTVYERAIRESWGREDLKKWAESEKTSRPLLPEAIEALNFRLPDITFDRILRVGANQEITVRNVGGHTPGSSVVVVEPEHVLFSGDLIFNGQFPYAGDPGADPDKWISALEEVRSAGFRTIIPGHGAVCDNHAVDEHIVFLTALRDAVKSALARGIRQEDFVKKGLMPKYYEDPAGYRIKTTLERWFTYYSLR
jgi:glyoxylase-like metal-dependent hydrolase (beta-lactamase superfamily II)